jgi:hypothetical protein
VGLDHLAFGVPTGSTTSAFPNIGRDEVIVRQ